MKHYYSYKGKWALITGGSRGIGASVAKELAKQGVNLYIHYNQSKEKALEVTEQCREHNVEVLPVQADFQREDGVEALFQQIPSIPQYVVNNAGEALYKLFTETGISDWNRLIQVNMNTPFYISQKVIPRMIQQDFGRIVNVSSIWGTKGAAMEVLYSTTKGALNAFTRSLAKEVGAHKITVNAVSPGAIQTEMLAKEFSKQDMRQIINQIPAGRLGNPEEVAQLISFLLSDQAAYITGQVIHCDGGWY